MQTCLLTSVVATEIKITEARSNLYLTEAKYNINEKSNEEKGKIRL
jgi:hypothetical protein